MLAAVAGSARRGAVMRREMESLPEDVLRQAFHGKGTEWLRHETGADRPGNLVGTATLAVRRCAVSARRPARE